MAKRREKEIFDKLSENTALLEHGIGVSFRDVPENKQFTKEDNLPVIIYDRKWIQNNQDYPTLLNNFIYLFEYTDLQFRSAFPDNKSNASVITDLFKVKGKKAYDPTTTFEIMRGLHSIQMQGYLDELQRINVNIEEIFKWFFEEYLLEEFQMSGFIYNISSQGTTYLEKCKNIASEIDAILKQYRIFSKYGYIDRELFEMSSEHIVFSQIKSNQQKKYLYAKSDRIKSCVNYLFKDSQFSYVEDERIKKCKNLHAALDNFKTVPKDIFKWPLQQQNLKTLIDFGTVIEDNGMLRLNRKNAIVLYRIYERDVICYHYCEKFHDELEKLVLQGDLSEENTLFSIPEQDYLNYILNKSAFSDGFDLRNKYIHGTNSKDEQIHFQDYLEFLKIMVLIVIKINEEFCLKYPIQ